MSLPNWLEVAPIKILNFERSNLDQHDFSHIL